MKGGASKVIMGATLVMVVTLAFVLTLILVLLAELYCSLLLRRRRRNRHLKHSTAASTVNETVTTPTTVTTSPLSSFYAQGVLDAPRDFLFPAVKDNNLTFLHEQVIESHGIEESNTKAHQIMLLSPTSPSSSFAASPDNPVEEISVETACNGASGSGVEDLVYISNPIYDAGRPEMEVETPFDTPDTSPSRLENCGSSSGDDDNDDEGGKGHFRIYSPLMTPPLSPMKKLPPQACSVSLGETGSLANSASDSNCNNGISSSSSGSPCTSPSW